MLYKFEGWANKERDEYTMARAGEPAVAHDVEGHDLVWTYEVHAENERIAYIMARLFWHVFLDRKVLKGNGD